MLHDDHHLSDKMTVVIKKAGRNDRRQTDEADRSYLRGKIMPSLRAPECKKAAFLTGASSGIGKAVRQVAFARRPRALLDKILRSQFGLA
jgi:hypothetical protein